MKKNIDLLNDKKFHVNLIAMTMKNSLAKNPIKNYGKNRIQNKVFIFIKFPFKFQIKRTFYERCRKHFQIFHV